VVPDTWHVVNDQDVVVHGLKLWGWYKRNGNRAIINRSGDLVVRPSLLEISLLQARVLRRCAHAQRIRWPIVRATLLCGRACSRCCCCWRASRPTECLDLLLGAVHCPGARAAQTACRSAAQGAAASYQRSCSPK
jgi:hypothetical protein